MRFTAQLEIALFGGAVIGVGLFGSGLRAPFHIHWLVSSDAWIVLFSGVIFK